MFSAFTRSDEMARPDSSEYARNYDDYVALVPEQDILGAMKSELATTLAMLKDLPDAEACVRHSPYTWSTKEVVGHITDAERIFGYRALRIARGDSTPLPSFEENSYAQEGQFDRLALNELLAEFEALRQSHIALFHNLPDSAWARRGIASNNEVSVRALAYIIVGHQRHHTAILRKRLSR
jgi:hypothetical protein